MQKGCVTVPSYRLGGRARQGPSQWQGHESFVKFGSKISAKFSEFLCEEPTDCIPSGPTHFRTAEARTPRPATLVHDVSGICLCYAATS